MKKWKKEEESKPGWGSASHTGEGSEGSFSYNMVHLMTSGGRCT